MKAFVAGATGETGRRIVTQLLEAQFEVRALVRDRQTAAEILPSTVEFVQADLQNVSELTAAMEGCDVILSATGARPSFNLAGPFSVDYLGTKNLVDASLAAGLQQFIMVSSLCVSKIFHPLNLFWLILLWKKQGEAYLRNSGMAYTIVRPGGLKSEDAPTPVVMKGADQLFEGSIPRSQVAAVCVTAINLSQAQNKVVEIVANDQTSSQPISELFAQVTTA